MLVGLQPARHARRATPRTIEAQGSRVPFVVATGHGSESVAVEMMKRGAYDYLVKGATFMKLLPAVIDQALERVRQAERLVEAEEQSAPAHEELEHRVQQRTAELAEANRACGSRWRSVAAPRNRCNSTRPSWPTWPGLARWARWWPNWPTN